jgi:hypothetical protein
MGNSTNDTPTFRIFATTAGMGGAATVLAGVDLRRTVRLAAHLVGSSLGNVSALLALDYGRLRAAA